MNCGTTATRCIGLGRAGNGAFERFHRNEVLPSLGPRLIELRKSLSAADGARTAVRSGERLHRDFELGTPVLLYHRVGPPLPGSNPMMTVAPAKFVRQMQWLADHGYTGVTPSAWLAWRNEGLPLPPKPVVITFDDAFADTATHALPVLKARGFSAAVFVVTGEIGGTNQWDLDGGWATAAHALMTPDAILHWHASGIEFGAHSRRHQDMRTLDDSALTAEVRGCAEDLTVVLGERPQSFAYPHGLYDPRVTAAVGAEFPLALTCDETGLNYLGTDPLRLRRVTILPQDSIFEFGLRVRLGWTPMEWVRRLTRHKLGRSAIRKFMGRLGP